MQEVHCKVWSIKTGVMEGEMKGAFNQKREIKG